MRSTGVVRKLDELGRVVLPIEIRRVFGIRESDPIGIYVDGSRIILEKYEPKCVICGIYPGSIKHSQKAVCITCIEELRELRRNSKAGSW